MAKFERQPIEVLVQGVKDFALANYNNGWCDLVIETMEDSEIAEVIREGKANTVRVAIIRMRQRWSAYAEMRCSVRNEVF
jgi:ribosomal protein L12E/L44/L45/RPP1/RPP2